MVKLKVSLINERKALLNGELYIGSSHLELKQIKT